MKSIPLLLVVLALCGCASVAPPAPSVPPAAAGPQDAAVAALAVERKWLQSWFQDTPVRIEQPRDRAVTVEVPREFCFDPGRTTIKPALAAVLDKVAESLRRVPRARLSLLTAPGDAAGTASLALQRALQVRRHLLSRGVPAARLGAATATTVAAVQLRIEATPP